jgi:hypothetical protein
MDDTFSMGVFITNDLILNLYYSIEALVSHLFACQLNKFVINHFFMKAVIHHLRITRYLIKKSREKQVGTEGVTKW